MEGMCDLSCQFCDNSPKESGRRQAQVLNSCPLEEFHAEVEAVNQACCDLRTGDCEGVPNSCDARCGIVFPGFFDRCQPVLALQRFAR